MRDIKIKSPYKKSKLAKLKAGDKVLITGVLYMARDAAHMRMIDDYKNGKGFPFDLCEQGIYYCGPAPARGSNPVGPAGPTTSTRMDAYTPTLLENGLAIMIGKGQRNEEVVNSIIKNKCVYLGATGGAAALLSKTIKSQQIIAYGDLGTEAIRKILVEEFPAVVIIDSDGNNLYEIGPRKYKQEWNLNE